MPELDELLQRIDAEVAAVEARLKQSQQSLLQDFQERQQRLQQFNTRCDHLRSIWSPRLQAFAQRFGDRVLITPHITPSRREGLFSFQSNLAKIEMRLTVRTDLDVRRLIVDYDLEILPMIFEYEPHAELAFALDAVDTEVFTRWLDDRLIGFVKTYLSLHENELFLKDHLVEDPVAHVRFADFAAAATLDWQGKTYHFISDETRKEFARQMGIPLA